MFNICSPVDSIRHDFDKIRHGFDSNAHRKPQKNREASKYISKPLKLTEQTDQFLDKHVSQTRRVESSSSSGESSGSSTHSGSSGTSHGGGGRSF